MTADNWGFVLVAFMAISFICGGIVGESAAYDDAYESGYIAGLGDGAIDMLRMLGVYDVDKDGDAE